MKNRGFTLLEMVVVIGIGTILVLFVLGILISNNRFYANQSGENEAIFNTRIIADRIASYGRGAAAVLSSYIYNSSNYVSDSDTLVLQVPSIDASANIIGGAYDHVIITRDLSDTSKLQLYVDPDASSSRGARGVLLTNKLDTMTFTYSSTTPDISEKVDYLIKITMGGSSPASEYIEGSVTLRNK